MAGTLFGILAVGILLLLVVAAVLVVGRVWTGAAPTLSLRSLLLGYLYVVVLASGVIAAAGVGQLLTAGMGQVAGLDVSYQTYRDGPIRPRPIMPPGVGEPSQAQLDAEAREREEQRVAQQVDQHRDATAQGVTAVLIGSLVGLIHLAAKRRLRGDDGTSRFLDRAEAILGLALYTLVGLVFAVMAVYQGVRWAFLPQVASFGQTYAPGGPLGYALAFVPVWIWRFRRFTSAAAREG